MKTDASPWADDSFQWEERPAEYGPGHSVRDESMLGVELVDEMPQHHTAAVEIQDRKQAGRHCRTAGAHVAMLDAGLMDGVLVRVGRCIREEARILSRPCHLPF